MLQILWQTMVLYYYKYAKKKGKIIMKLNSIAQLGQLKTQLVEDNLPAMCNVIVNFFKTTNPSQFDDFIAESSEDFFNQIRSHAFALKLGDADYFSALRQDDAKYQQFLLDISDANGIITKITHTLNWIFQQVS